MHTNTQCFSALLAGLLAASIPLGCQGCEHETTGTWQDAGGLPDRLVAWDRQAEPEASR